MNPKLNVSSKLLSMTNSQDKSISCYCYFTGGAVTLMVALVQGTEFSITAF